jgi:ATP:corrinoid adenosyltransferase
LENSSNANQNAASGQEEKKAVGRIFLITGPGKAKSAACAGLTARFIGRGYTALYCQYFKDGTSGECFSLRALGAEVRSASAGGKFLWQMDEADREETGRRIGRMNSTVIRDAEDFMVIGLDEALDAVSEGLMRDEDIMSMVSANPSADFIISGEKASEALREAADYCIRVETEKRPQSPVPFSDD